MKKNKLYVLVAITTTVFLLSSACILTQCLDRIKEKITPEKNNELIEILPEDDHKEEKENTITEKIELKKEIILFTSTIDEDNKDIYTINADGTGLMVLTNRPAVDFFPRWSPDKQKIAFLSRSEFSDYEDELFDIYVMNADGTDINYLSSKQSLIGDNLVWSPDGQRIVFSSSEEVEMEEEVYNEDTDSYDIQNVSEWQIAIYIVNVNGTGLKRLSDIQYNSAIPSFSPDGRKIAFAQERDDNTDIYVVNIDGTGLMRLTRDPEIDTWPSWSPIDKKIAFMSYRNDDHGLYVINDDGTGLIKLIGNQSDDTIISWSPDGQKIAFKNPYDNYNIYTINIDGTGLINLTNSESGATFLDWSPDSKKIAFISGDYDYENLDIFVMDADGSNKVNITNGRCSVFWFGLDWSP